MEALLTIILGLAVTYVLFEIFGFSHVSNEPEAPERATDPTYDGEALVVENFVSAGSSQVSSGKVELNGTTWTAEHHSDGVEPKIGDRVRIMQRNRLTLIVEPIRRLAPDRPG